MGVVMVGLNVLIDENTNQCAMWLVFLELKLRVFNDSDKVS